MNPKDNRRLSVYPHVEVEPTADVFPSGPARDAGDQGRDGRIICAGSGSEPARQGPGGGRSFDSGHGSSPPAHPRRGRSASTAQSCRNTMSAGTPDFRGLGGRALRWGHIRSGMLLNRPVLHALATCGRKRRRSAHRAVRPDGPPLLHLLRLAAPVSWWVYPDPRPSRQPAVNH
jgi:hypothetical protein